MGRNVLRTIGVGSPAGKGVEWNKAGVFCTRRDIGGAIGAAALLAGGGWLGVDLLLPEGP